MGELGRKMTKRRKPPRDFGEAGPPIPLIGQAQRERIYQANRPFMPHPDGPVRGRRKPARSYGPTRPTPGSAYNRRPRRA